MIAATTKSATIAQTFSRFLTLPNFVARDKAHRDLKAFKALDAHQLADMGITLKQQQDATIADFT